MQSSQSTTKAAQPVGKPSRIRAVFLWILQVLLAAAFLLHGGFMLMPPADMVAMIDGQLGTGLRLFIGVTEVLAAIGLIGPGVTRIMPWVTAWAAIGLMIIMVCATVLHVMRGEISSAITTAILLVMATVVAVLRWEGLPLVQRARAAEPHQ